MDSCELYLTIERRETYNAMYSSSTIQILLHFSPRFDFPLPVNAPLIFRFIAQCTLSLFLYLVLLAPINLHSLYIVLFILY